MKRHLYKSNGVLHACESSDIHHRVRLVWTKCGRDVPANASFRSEEEISCPACKESEK